MSAIPVSRTRAPWRPPEPTHPTLHIEVVSSREQKRARPRLVPALITVACLFGILAVQLLLSIASSEGAYEIASLQAKHVELSRDQQILTEQLQVLGAPQHLAAEAQSMGMVAATSAAHLRLADGTVLGEPTAAGGSAPMRMSADGSPLVPDALLTTVPLTGASTQAEAVAAAAQAAAQATAGAASVDGSPGAPSATSTGGLVTSSSALGGVPGEATVGIPSPQTH